MRIELIPHGLLRRKIDVLVDGAQRGRAERKAWSRDLRLTLDGSAYRVTSEGWLRRKWTLSEGTRTRATAEPEGFFGSSHRVALRGSGGFRSMSFGADAFLGSARSLKAGSRSLARFRTRGVFSVGQRIETQSDLPLEVLVFIGLLAISLNEKRRRGAAGAGGAAAAGAT